MLFVSLSLEPASVMNNVQRAKGSNVEIRRRNGMILEIDGYLLSKYRKHPTQNDEVYNLQALQQYLRRLDTGMDMTSASLETAIGLVRGVHFSRRVILWYNQWEQNEAIVISRRGKNPKTKNLLNDSDNYNDIRTWILENYKYTITPHILQRHVNNVFLPALGIERSICWLKALGWIYSHVKKGIYLDGHERDDVVEYRKVFLDRMESLERRMVTIDTEDQTKVVYSILVCAIGNWHSQLGKKVYMYSTQSISILGGR